MELQEIRSLAKNSLDKLSYDTVYTITEVLDSTYPKKVRDDVNLRARVYYQIKSMVESRHDFKIYQADKNKKITFIRVAPLPPAMPNAWVDGTKRLENLISAQTANLNRIDRRLKEVEKLMQEKSGKWYLIHYLHNYRNDGVTIEWVKGPFSFQEAEEIEAAYDGPGCVQIAPEED